jgi:hypothetical protein
MAYLDIDNLYKNRDIFLFKECIAAEKIHGTSAHVRWRDGKVSFFSGGVDHASFVKLFDEERLCDAFKKLEQPDIVVYGEAYGGKCQGMSATYGKDLRFVAFECRVGNHWLNLHRAEYITTELHLDFVPYRVIPATIEALDAEIMLDSEQAVKVGMGPGHMREGIVVHPPIEVTRNNGGRIIAKHKRADFAETKTPRPLSEDRLKVLAKAQEIADEWVTEMRLTHVLDAFPNADLSRMGEIIKAMVGDIEKEAVGEITEITPETHKTIARNTALLFKRRLSAQLREA